MSTYPVFDNTLWEMKNHLNDFGAEWSLIEDWNWDSRTTRINDSMKHAIVSCDTDPSCSTS